jgi:hypothetical protein
MATLGFTKAFGLGCIAALLSAQVAHAACQISSASAMYLGDGGSYSLSAQIQHGEACTVDFSAVNGAATFESADIVSQALTGKIAKTAPFSFSYQAPASGTTDSFALKVCGTDTHGRGCNTLTYSVTMSD